MNNAISIETLKLLNIGEIKELDKQQQADRNLTKCLKDLKDGN